MPELELIDAIGSLLDAGAGAARIVRGPGDDAAVVRARGYAVTSIDTLVDGVHFRSAQLRAGRDRVRAMASALSDLAAMACDPGEAYIALCLPATRTPTTRSRSRVAPTRSARAMARRSRAATCRARRR